MNFDCSVCWEPLTVAVEPNGGGPVSTDIIATRCGHLYHTICLQSWLGTQRNAGCPTCRAAIRFVNCMRLYPSRDDAETEGRVSKIKEMKQKIEKLEVDLKKASTNAEKQRKVQEVQLNSKSIELDSVKEMLIDERRKSLLENWNFIDIILKLKEEKESLEKLIADSNVKETRSKFYWKELIKHREEQCAGLENQLAESEAKLMSKQEELELAKLFEVDLTKAKRQREVDLKKANADAEKERMVQKSLKVELNSKSIELESVKDMLIEQRQRLRWEVSYWIDRVVKLKQEKEKIEVDLKNATTNAEKERTVQKLLKDESNSKSIELDGVKGMLIEQGQKWTLEELNFIHIISKLKEEKEKRIVDLTKAKRQREIDLEKANANAEKERMVQKSLKVQLNSKCIELDSVKAMLIEQRQKWIREESNFINIVVKLNEEKEKRDVDLQKAKWQGEVDLKRAKRQHIEHILLVIFSFTILLLFACVAVSM